MVFRCPVKQTSEPQRVFVCELSRILRRGDTSAEPGGAGKIFLQSAVGRNIKIVVGDTVMGKWYLVGDRFLVFGF